MQRKPLSLCEEKQTDHNEKELQSFQWKDKTFLLSVHLRVGNCAKSLHFY